MDLSIFLDVGIPLGAYVAVTNYVTLPLSERRLWSSLAGRCLLKGFFYGLTWPVTLVVMGLDGFRGKVWRHLIMD